MAEPLSTSSSRASHSRPTQVLFLLAFLSIVLGVDRLMWGSLGPWQKIDDALSDCGSLCRVIRNKAFSESELARLATADADRYRVAVIGSSRAGAGFRPQQLAKQDPILATLHFAKIAMPAMEPFTMRGLASRFDRENVDEVVLYLSEFDTHRPPYLVPTVGFGGFRAVTDFVQLVGPRQTWRHRESLLRLTLASMLGTYRHRDVIKALGRDQGLTARVASIGDEPARKKSDLEIFSNALAMSAPTDAILTHEEFERISAGVRPEFPEPVNLGPFRQLRSVSLGPHVAVQKGLVRKTVETFVEKGIRILIVEAPVHPSSLRFYDEATRRDFRNFATDLARSSEVESLALDPLAPFHAEDFSDLTHLNADGARRLTRKIVDRLGQRSRSDAPSAGS